MPATISVLPQKPSLPGLDGVTHGLERVNAARDTLNAVRFYILAVPPCLYA